MYSQDGGGNWGSQDKEAQEIRKYMQAQFGDRLSSFLYPPDGHQRLFGRWLKIIRETRPPEERVVQSRRKLRTRRRNAALRIPQPSQDQRSKCLSQKSLARKATTAWGVIFKEVNDFDDRIIRKLEAGEYPLTLQLVVCFAAALRADKQEFTILLDAAGYNGWDWYKSQVKGSGSGIFTYIEAGVNDYDLNGLAPAEILHVVKLKIDAQMSDDSQG